MPATEQTWRNQRVMNAVFGASSLVLLIATVWMLWADHTREWKPYQRKFRDVEARISSWRIQEQKSLDFEQEERELEVKAQAAPSIAPDRAVLERLVVETLYHPLAADPARAALVPLYDSYKVGKLPAAELLARLREVGVDNSTAKGEARLRSQVLENAERFLAASDPLTPDLVRSYKKQLVNSLDKLLRVVRFNEGRAAGQKKFAVADQAVKDSNFGMGVRDSVDDSQLAALQEDFEAEEARVAALDLDVQRLTIYRKALESARKDILLPELEAEKALSEHRANLTLLEKIKQDRFGGIWRAISRNVLEMPIIDAFGRPLKIDQIWLPDLTQDFNFKRVARFDRCTTCHLGIDKTAPGSAVDPSYPQSRPIELSLDTSSANPRVTGEETVKEFSAAMDALVAAHTSSNEETDASKKASRFSDLLAAFEALAEKSTKTVGYAALLSDDSRNIVSTQLSKAIELATQVADTVKNSVQDVAEVNGKRAKLQLALESFAGNPDPLQAVFGVTLSEQGLVSPGDVTVAAVAPGGIAAKAGIVPGDVISRVGESMMRDAADVRLAMVDGPSWKEGETLKVTVVRGLPQPYSSHPRLDLFVGSLSPHKMMEMGCTSCHEGQGSATTFKFASHTPSTPADRREWSQKYGWYDNHHWIYPMYSSRFAESSCLKCHHGVMELEPSDRFPKAPAPKVTAGYHLIREYGCFGCHEINGYDGPNRRVGPDMRLEPNYSPVAQALLDDSGLTDDERALANTLVSSPENHEVRRRLQESLLAGLKATEGSPRLGASAKGLADGLSDSEAPGNLRKVGPSLRYLASKVDPTFIYRWLENTMDFRPSTKMPRFFGLHDHLTPDQKAETAALEDVEMRAITAYLLAKSVPFTYDAIPSTVTAAPSAERGKTLFQTRCLSCHSHVDFPEAKADQGPDLSRMGGKLKETDKASGSKWLYTWLKNPSKYHARTFMPNMKLEVVTLENGQTADMAADIAAYLLASNADNWFAEELTPWGESHDVRLNDLVLSHLKGVVDTRSAEKFVKQGIPQELASEFKGDEVELLGEPSASKKLVYLGKRAIGKYGCYACHDIPGFETAKPIGAALADWGRKDPSRIAFEHVAEYLHRGLLAHGSDTAGHTSGSKNSSLQNSADEQKTSHADAPVAARDRVRNVSVETGNSHGVDTVASTGKTSEPGSGEAHHAVDTLDLDPDVGYFVEAINGHNRIGFLWQKLREPRSYDFRKVENKPYNDRLRMPKFNFSPEQIESVMTFVLGLVADPPANKYIYKPDLRKKAELDGLVVLQKYNCGGCHQLKNEKWTVAYSPEEVGEPPQVLDYEFLKPHFTQAQLNASATLDRAGMLKATVEGRPVIRDTDGQMELVDQDYLPIEPDENGEISSTEPMFYQFVLWKDAAIGGKAFRSGDKLPLIRTDRLLERIPAMGGDLGRWIYPFVLATERQLNPSADKDQAWGWLPPPLFHEGEKVRPSWLHDYLLEPYAIRPAAILRMPKFNMSSDEAGKLVDYFAAVSGAEFPYVDDARTTGAYLSAKEESHPGHLKDALNIVTSSDYCVKCHSVADYNAVGKPTAFGTDKAAGPDLSKVYHRLRPEYMHHWIANPKVILPYTGMPVNIAPDKPVSQNLYPGSSNQQLEALVDLLSNFDQFARSQTKIAPLVKPATTAPSSGAAPAEGAAGNQADGQKNKSDSAVAVSN